MGYEHRECEGEVSELVEITPPAYRCGDIVPTCPVVFEVREITPEAYRCGGGISPHCHAVFETEPEKLVIIGKIVNYEALQGRVGSDEAAVEIPCGLVTGLFVPNES